MPPSEPPKQMSVGERDKMMDKIATTAATAFCRKCEGINDQEIERAPEAYLGFTIPYLTVRTLHRLEADSRWIKIFAIVTGILTAVLVCLTIVLAKYAGRLDEIIHPRLSSQHSTRAELASPQASPPFFASPSPQPSPTPLVLPSSQASQSPSVSPSPQASSSPTSPSPRASVKRSPIHRHKRR